MIVYDKTKLNFEYNNIKAISMLSIEIDICVDPII